MGIWITGDIHGNPVRLSTDSFYEQKEFSGDKDENIVIVCGDFGLIWNRGYESKNEKYWLNWLESKPFTTVFVDGNHSNHPQIYTYPVKEWNSGRVHEIRPHVLHLIRGRYIQSRERSFLHLEELLHMIFRMVFWILISLMIMRSFVKFGNNGIKKTKCSG